MELHYELEHTHVCSLCEVKFATKELLNNHEDSQHPNKCDEILSDSDSHALHILNSHTYECDVCGFTGQGEEALEDHILDMHATPSEDNFYKCDDCPYKSVNKVNFGKHYKTLHGSGYRLRNKKTQHRDKEYKELKNNFERLNRLYQESLDSANKAKAEHEARIIKADDDYTRIASQNEALKEKVEVLFKLGRSIIDNRDTSKENNTTALDNALHLDTSTLVATEKGTDVNRETFTDNTAKATKDDTWTREKLCGFRKTKPSGNAVSDAIEVEVNDKAEEAIDTNTEHNSEPTSSNRICHYFANSGQCRYEDRTGLKCKFVHKAGSPLQKVPLCQYGINCRKLRCTLSHPKINQNWNSSGAPPFFSEHESITAYESMANPVQSDPLAPNCLGRYSKLSDAAVSTKQASIKLSTTRRGINRKYKTNISKRKLTCIGTNAAGLNTKRESLLHLLNKFLQFKKQNSVTIEPSNCLDMKSTKQSEKKEPGVDF